METSFIKYGRKDEKDLCEITLTNDAGMQVKVLNYGATLEKVLMPDGKNMILSLEKPEDYSKERNYLGGTVGRICGRVKAGQWKHGNEIVQLPLNEGKNHVHGGLGIDTKVWDFKLHAEDDKAKVDLFYFDPDGSNSFPGNMKIHVVCELDNENNLKYEINAVSDKLTIFNPANHTYFSLGESAKNLKLKVNADYYVPVAADGIPTQGMASVKDTAFDFTKEKTVNGALTADDEQIKSRRGMDHPLILNGNSPAVVLSSKNHKMTMTTNAPAVVVYTGNHFDHTGLAKNIGQYDGITFEAQCPPVGGSDLGEITLLPNEKYERKVCWNFE
ncbi:galactose mutarotase [Lactobacillus hamsteri]|uniref:Galactose-1-epimerase n=1 Tax=Lactobacillus hamsteri DSM 5661 = JCM 6256 TaxID=1423754 RepID=A0A0R1YQ12_9LACO|nr:aldose epimerase family protein [Lactobacillus hamsteri]KRM41308.1 galactose-1-epimerase [Lactobacillus hamsteri DSM 5661 = JCM 6256]